MALRVEIGDDFQGLCGEDVNAVVWAVDNDGVVRDFGQKCDFFLRGVAGGNLFKLLLNCCGDV